MILPKPSGETDNYKFLFGAIFLLNTQLEKIGPSVLGELTTKQWFLLACLTTLFSSPPTIVEVSNTLHMSHQNVKQVAVRMEKKGFFQLLTDPKDKRATRIHLTKKCAQYAQEFDGPSALFLQKLFTDVPPKEAQACYGTLVKMLTALDKMHTQYNEEVL